jgi:hypothetical protein
VVKHLVAQSLGPVSGFQALNRIGGQAVSEPKRNELDNVLGIEVR